MLINKQNPDNLYYDCTLIGKADEDTKAIFNINRTNVILENPSEYYLSIVDFSIPLFSVPLFTFKTGLYIFRLEFDGLILSDTLIWIPESAYTAVVANAVYSYQSMITSMNESLGRLYTAMQSAKPNFLATEQIFITLENNLITINIEDWYYNNNSFLYSNDPLFEFLRSISVFFIDYNNIRYEYFNHMPSYQRFGKTYYKLTQSNIEIDNWNSLRAILFETGTIPVEPENVAAQNNIQLFVIGDFIKFPTVNRPTFYDFIKRGTDRLYDLNSTYPMKQIDIIVRWFSRDNETGIIIIPFGQVFDVKIAFYKKIQQTLLNLEGDGAMLKG
jgi:hypothetical protein